MNAKLQQLQEAAAAIADAASPDGFAVAVANLLEIASCHASEAARDVTDAWQEIAPGRPWLRVARDLDGKSDSLRLLARLREVAQR